MTLLVSPALSVEDVPLDRLRPDPANPRRISEDELDALERSLRQFGFVQPVLARREDGVVIGGHQRLVAARRLGLTSVPVTWLDVSEEQARLLGLALNKISGSWDDALLARLLADLQATPDLDLTLSGFGEDEVKDLLRSLDVREKRERPEAFDLEEALEEARRAPRTKPGDLWALGDHRLLCGDATSAADVARLLDGATPTLLTTDPPYGVSLDRPWRDGVYNALGPAEAPLHADRWPPRWMTPHGPPWRPWANEGPSEHDALGRHPRRLVGGVRPRPVPHRRLRLARRGACRRGGRGARADRLRDRRPGDLGQGPLRHRAELVSLGPRALLGRPQGGRQGALPRLPRPGHDLAGPQPEDDHGRLAPRRSRTTRPRSRSSSSRPPSATTCGPVTRSTTRSSARARRSSPPSAAAPRCYGMEIDPLYVEVALRRWERFSGETAVRVDG